jgi:N-acetylglucosamine-6-sulfatase
VSLRLGLRALGAWIALVALWTVALEDGAPAQRTQSRPNIVIVMTDDQTVEQMQALTRVRTLLGRPGTTFTRNFATFPWCCPSRATYLTGQYSHNHGVRSNSPPVGGFSKLDSSNTLPIWLRDAGYATAHIGRYLNGYGIENRRHVPAGWQEWHAFVAGSRYFDFCLNENGRLVWYGRAAPYCGAQRQRVYSSDVYSRKAVDYIDRRAPNTQPFFLSVAYGAPMKAVRMTPARAVPGSPSRPRATAAPSRTLRFQSRPGSMKGM